MNADTFLSDLSDAVSREGVSQIELCRKSGLSQGAISKLINGKNRKIRFDTVVSLWPFVYGLPFPNMVGSPDSPHD